ncbi:hypothetical protein D3C86_2185750 [compost metagenome]
MHAEHPEFAELRDELPREDGVLVPAGDVGADPLPGEVAHAFTDGQFLLAQEGIEGKDIRGIRR